MRWSGFSDVPWKESCTNPSRVSASLSVIPPRILRGASAMAAALMLAGVVSPVAAAPDKIAKAPPLPDLHPGPSPDRHRAASSHSRARKPHGRSMDQRQQESNGQLANAREDAGHSWVSRSWRIGTATVSPRRACSPVVTGWRQTPRWGPRRGRVRFLRLRWRYSTHRPS